MDGYSGIVMLQSNHPQFIECYKNIVEIVGIQEYIFHSQSCSFHRLSNNHTLILTAGYILAKFAQAVRSLEKIKEVVKFGLLKENNTFIELNLIHIGYDDWIVNKLKQFGCEIEVGCVLYLEMINNSDFKIIPKYTSSLQKQGQELITMSSPFASEGQEMYKNYYRKAHVSQQFTFQNFKQLLMLDMISQIGQEGGSVFNSKGEYVGMILQNWKLKDLNTRYFTFCLNWETIKSILGKNTQILEQSFFNSKMIDYMLSVSQLCHQSQTAASCTIIKDNSNNRNYVLTASHCLNSHLKGSSFLVGESEFTAELIEDCFNNMDFALAELNSEEQKNSNIKGIPIEEIIYQRTPEVGQTVYVVGFLQRLFENSPCLAKGSIIKLIYDKENLLIAIVTDCFIHRGYSGGGLFTENGELLGLVSFNISVASDGMVCDLNYITPIFPFQPIFKDLQSKKKITEKSKHLFSIQNPLAGDLRKLRTITELPTIGYKPKL